jgi:hypothetical protein
MYSGGQARAFLESGVGEQNHGFMRRLPSRCRLIDHVDYSRFRHNYSPALGRVFVVFERESCARGLVFRKRRIDEAQLDALVSAPAIDRQAPGEMDRTAPAPCDQGLA